MGLCCHGYTGRVSAPSPHAHTHTHTLIATVYSFGDETLRGNCSVGQLTSIGFKQHIDNGGHLATAYVNGQFLSKALNTSELYLRSDGERACTLLWYLIIVPCLFVSISL